MSQDLFPGAGMPIFQANARTEQGLLVRVGIPHNGGKLAFHAFRQGYAAMVSANAFWDSAARRFRIPAATDLSELDFALDSAGYTAMKLWKAKGPQRGIAGVYPWTYEEYMELASLSGAAWVSAPDLCCEAEIASDQSEVDYRVDATATLLEGFLRVAYAWQDELSRTTSADAVNHLIRLPVPVLQGRSVGDYKRSLDLTMKVWQRWEPWLAPPKLIGLGSVCRRNLTDPGHGLYAILAGLEGHLPSGTRLHLFGVKGRCLSEIRTFDWIASADSMAFDYAARVKARELDISNSIAHRSEEMSRWMGRAVKRATPAAGDQFRLTLPV